MPSSTLDPSTWRLPTPQEHIDRVKSIGSKDKPRVRSASAAIFSRLISPVDLYCYLKGRFGSPNGFQSFLKNPLTSDNLVHWHYELKAGDDGWIDLQGFTTSIHIMAGGHAFVPKAEWIAFAETLKQEYAKYGEAKSAVLKGLEKWRLFLNPYRRLENVVDSLYADVKEANARKFPKLRRPMTNQEIRRWTDVAKQKAKITSELVQKGLSLKLITPVFTESFINLLIFLLAKPEIKGDDRVYEATIRQQIDVRVSSMAVYCNHFAKPIDSRSEEFKAFKRVMDSRNDFIHGNVDPIKFGFEDIYFDANTPLYKRGGEVFEFASSNSLRFIDPDQVLGDVDVVKTFIQFLIGHLKPPVIAQLQNVLQTTELGWHVADKRVGVLLPPHVVDTFMGFKSRDDSLFVDTDE